MRSRRPRNCSITAARREGGAVEGADGGAGDEVGHDVVQDVVFGQRLEHADLHRAEARAAAEHVADRSGEFGDRGNSQPTRLKYQRSTTTVRASMAIARGKPKIQPSSGMWRTICARSLANPSHAGGSRRSSIRR
jgi:hypothetical protein